MSKTPEQIKKELDELRKLGSNILSGFSLDKKTSVAGSSIKLSPKELVPLIYQEWYTKSLPVIRQLMPERYQEFIDLYKSEKRKEIDYLTYTISDYLIGVQVTRGGKPTFNTESAFLAKLQLQLLILQSASSRVDSLLSNIQGVLQAELFDDELSASEELLKKGHLRAAGTLAGVTLERHLSTVLTNHGFKLAKKTPTIADLNNELKNQGVYDVPDWRFIERLGDIRNYCAHSKEREPTKDEVHEMIEGVKKVIKTIF